jgi:hypothetical protein
VCDFFSEVIQRDFGNRPFRTAPVVDVRTRANCTFRPTLIYRFRFLSLVQYIPSIGNLLHATKRKMGYSTV